MQQHWDHRLNALHVTTPDLGVDLMLNRWLVYQVLACRVWARSAFYQSGGAYGFRDQLQDVMALVYSAPAEARAQILRAAARQFEEGDVQHWWHPPSGIGVRTRITDDLYFLPLVVHHYVVTTGDTDLLDAVVPFIASPVLREEQEEDFSLPAASEQRGTVYEHCVRALKYGYRLGPHGLPLMGTGDWNDGMNKVGAQGKGESVWNGWFFVTVLNAFADVAEQRSQSDDANWCRERAEQLRTLWRRTPGTARGTAAPISTMALRWDPLKTMNARSTPSRKRGQSFPGWQTRPGSSRPWMRFKNGWCVSTTN